MALISCTSCIYYTACSKWSSITGESARRFPFCKENEKPCYMYLSKTEHKLKIIKEFVEEIKEHQYQSSDWSHGEHPYVIEVDDIDDALLNMED